MRIAALFTLVVLVGCTGAGVKKEERPDPLRLKLETYLDRLEKIGFSGTVLVAKEGKVVLEEAYGPGVRRDSVFTIGSITKQFTGAAILKLEMQGKLQVTDSITKFFDNVPEDKRGITLHHLLTHTSGLPDNLGSSDFEVVATDAYLKRVFEAPLQSEPGRVHRYSNAGYSTLGIIVERVSGQSYDAYLRENLFLPAGMKETGYRLPAWPASRLAHGFEDGEDWGTVAERYIEQDGPFWNLKANGGIHSTAADMYRWQVALKGDKILSDEAKRKYETPHVAENPGGDSHYGYGWAIFRTSRDTKLVTHDGGNGIFFADFHRYVDEGVCLVLMTGRWEYQEVSWVLPRIIFGAPYSLPPNVIETDDFEKHVGRYQKEISIGLKDGRLQLLAESQEAMWALEPPKERLKPKLREMGRQGVRIADAAFDGDFRPMSDALGGTMSPEQIAQSEGLMFKFLQVRLGPFAGAELVGTSRTRRSVIRLKFERGERFMIFEWEDGLIAGLDLRRSLGGRRLYPVKGGYETFDLRSLKKFRVVFGSDEMRVGWGGEFVRLKKVK